MRDKSEHRYRYGYEESEVAWAWVTYNRETGCSFSLSLPCDRVASSNVYLLGRNEFHLQGMRTMQHAICPTFWVCSTRSPCLCHIASLTTSTSTGVWHSIQERRDRTTGCGKQGSSVCVQGMAETRLGTRAMVFMVRIWYVVSLLARTNRGCHGSEEYS